MNGPAAPSPALTAPLPAVTAEARREEPASRLFTRGAVERHKQRIDRLAYVLLLSITALLVVPLIAILTYLVVKAWPVLSWSLLIENPRHYMTAGGLWAPLVGTFDVVVLSLLLAAPIGVLAGVYLNEYARDGWTTRVVNLAVLNLAGVPSIVHALFGVGMFVLAARFGRSVLAAACTLAVMTLPVIIASTQQALAAVPFAFREACWILGASRWQTIRAIVLPNAWSGILTGVILQVSRAAGETAPILFTGAVFFVSVPDGGWQSYVPYGWSDPFMALSYHLFTLTSQVTGVSDALEYGTAVVLISLVMAVNAVSIVVRSRLRSRRKW
jgi:phosphate transport system permease protein